jgi:DnaJ like chaperone protein
MALLFRLIRFILPLLLIYLVYQVMGNLLYYLRASGYNRGRSEYYGERNKGTSTEKGGPYHKSDPYSVLGCTSSSSDEEIRVCYRKMVARYHPDKFIGQELDQEFIDLATEKFKQIQDAYDHIKKMRGMA